VDPAIRAQFHPEPGLTYLDTATYGLPPDRTLEALKRAEDEWRAGTGVWVEWDRQSERARDAFARLMHVPAGRVALLPAASVGVGVVAAALQPGDRVVTPRAEFRSVLYPLLVARDRGIDLVEVENEDALVDAITPGTKLVALSLVQMQTGRVLPIRDIVDRAEQVGARVLLDATHGIPFVPLDDVIDRLDYLVAAAYKHLLCSRGVAFMILRDDHVGPLPPIVSSWRASDDPYRTFFGGPLSLAEGAAQYDASLAWHPWLAAAESLELLADWQAAGVLEGPVALARSLAGKLGLDWTGSTLVCPRVDDPDAVRAALTEHRIKAAFRGTALRLSTHVYNDEADIDLAARVLGPLVAPSSACVGSDPPPRDAVGRIALQESAAQTSL
jgi:selenocysteine lyase/cysteine desulfurase